MDFYSPMATTPDAEWARLNHQDSGNRKRKFGEEISADDSAFAPYHASHDDTLTHYQDQTHHEDSMLAEAADETSTAELFAAHGGDHNESINASTADAGGPPSSKTAKRSRMSLAGLPTALRERTNSLVSSSTKKVSGMVRNVQGRSLNMRRSSRRKGETASRSYFGQPKTAPPKPGTNLWSDSMDKDRIAAMPRAELNRREALHELVQGEEDFVALLAHTIKVYQTPLIQVVPEVTVHQHERLFANIAAIHALHDNLKRQMQAARTQEGGCPVGRILTAWLPTCVEAYKQYCANQPKSKYILSVLRRNKKFIELDETARDLPHSNKKTLAALLDAPRVRLQNYRLFLLRIFKLTPADDEDYFHLKQAIDVAHTVVSQVDEFVASDHHDQIVEMQKRMEAAQKTQLDYVASDAQLLLSQKASTKDDKELELYLFSTSLLIMRVKKRRGDGVVPLALVGKPIPIDALCLDEMTDDCDCHMTIRFAESALARSSSLRGSLTRRSSVYSRSSFTIKFLCSQDKAEFWSAVVNMQQGGMSRSGSVKSVGGEAVASSVAAARAAAAAAVAAAGTIEE